MQTRQVIQSPIRVLKEENFKALSETGKIALLMPTTKQSTKKRLILELLHHNGQKILQATDREIKQL
jgi:hypothetical protein